MLSLQHGAVCVQDREGAVRLGRYMIRCPIVLEFLARVIDHIPEPSQQTMRYWGYYANAAIDCRHSAT